MRVLNRNSTEKRFAIGSLDYLSLIFRQDRLDDSGRFSISGVVICDEFECLLQMQIKLAFETVTLNA